MTSIKYFLAFIFFTTLSITKTNGQGNDKADEYFKIAEDFRNKSQPDSAITYYEKAAIEFTFLDNTERFLDSYNQIGALLTRQDKYEKSHEYLDKALQLGLSFDSTSLTMANTYINLGVLYAAEDQLDQSLIYHNKSLSIRLKKLGENNTSVATSYGNIGNVYFRKKDYDNAIDAHLKAMKIRENLFGEKSIEVIQSYNNLGNAYKEKKNYKKSLQYYEKALNNKILLTSPENKDLVKFYKNISDVYYLMDDKENGDAFKLKSEEAGKKS